MDSILVIFKLIPALIDALMAIEAAIPASGQGTNKLNAIKAIIMNIDSAYLKYWAGIQSTITVLINLFNTSGTFTTTVKTPQVNNAVALQTQTSQS